MPGTPQAVAKWELTAFAITCICSVLCLSNANDTERNNDMEPVTKKAQHPFDPFADRTSVIDTETTGTDKLVDRVISFGWVLVVDGKIVETLEWFFNPGDQEIHPDALKVHGITKEFLADKPPIKDYLPKILSMVARSILCGHNVKFDTDMLDAEMARHGLPSVETFTAGVHDTMLESRKRWPGKRASLDELCARVGVSTAHRTKHGALTDALLCAEALLAMNREQRSLLLASEADDTSTDVAGNLPALAPVLVLPASAQELDLHESYLAGMRGAGATVVWDRFAVLVEDLVEDVAEEDTPAMAMA